eukprot:1122231-Prorocentrum_lima.AAC.1
MGKDPQMMMLFQYGGTCYFDDGTSYEGTGLQHIVHRLCRYFKEHNQSELLRISTEYTKFSRRPGEA